MIFTKFMDGSETDQEFKDFIHRAVSNLVDTAQAYLVLCQKRKLERNGLKTLNDLDPDFQEEIIDSLSLKPREMGLWLQEVICGVGMKGVKSPQGLLISILRKYCHGQGKYLVKYPIISPKTRPLDKIPNEVAEGRKNKTSLHWQALNDIITRLKKDYWDKHPEIIERAKLAASNIYASNFVIIIPKGTKLNAFDVAVDWFFAQYTAEAYGLESPENCMLDYRYKRPEGEMPFKNQIGTAGD